MTKKIDTLAKAIAEIERAGGFELEDFYQIDDIQSFMNLLNW